MIFTIIMVRGSEKKILFIRCTEVVDTRKKFRKFVAEYDFPDYEDALLELLRIAEAHPDLVREKGIRWG